MVRTLLESDAALPEMQGAWFDPPDGVGERAVQVAPVQQDVGEAVELDRDCAAVEQFPGLSGAPEPDLLGGRNRAHPCDGVSEAECMQYPRAVGADLDTSAHVLELRGLLVDLDVDAFAQQRQSRREAP